MIKSNCSFIQLNQGQAQLLPVVGSHDKSIIFDSMKKNIDFYHKSARDFYGENNTSYNKTLITYQKEAAVIEDQSIKAAEIFSLFE